MGLDMYLHGEKYFWTDWENSNNNRMEDGYRINTVTLELGYWRKHPNLGKDNCQKIELDADAIKKIIEAVKNEALPETSGFFFGRSDGSEKEMDLKIFEGALLWLGKKQPEPVELMASTEMGDFYEVKLPAPKVKDSRTVYYQASW